MLRYKLQLIFICIAQIVLYCLFNVRKNDENESNGLEEIRHSPAPDTEYERARRKSIQDAKELLWYLEAELSNSSSEEEIQTILMEVKSRQSIILSQFDDISLHDGYKSWREKEHLELSDIVQRRIYSIQNPQSCSNAKKLLCSLDSDCGFGCQFKRIVICLIISYATERTMLLETRDWSYSCEGGGKFEDIFQHPSNSCVLHRDYDISGKEILDWPGTEDAEVIKYSFARHSGDYIPNFIPPFIPEDLVDRIILLHENPALWWVSQFVKFLWKFQPTTQLMLNEIARDFESREVIVGIHIRRSDKITEKESQYHTVDEYMKYAKEYFDQEEIKRKVKLTTRNLFVSSDDPTVFNEIRNKFPEYEVLGDDSRSRSASLKYRYSIKSLMDLISDIHFLSLSDYIVCTLSSNVCRLAYEIQQQRFSDGSRNVHYLDNHWASFIRGNQIHQHVEQAIYSHQANSPLEISFDIGDKISDIKHQQDGYGFGRLEKNNLTGMYPRFKTIGVTKTFAFPSTFNSSYYTTKTTSLNEEKEVETDKIIGKSENLNQYLQ